MSVTKMAKLRTGHHMPLLGLGCCLLGEEASQVVEIALDAGYRHLDTAHMYQTEGSVGEGLRRWIVKEGGTRDDVFLVTKLPLTGMHKGGPARFLKESLEHLQLEYVDLYLVHVPVGAKERYKGDRVPRDENGDVVLDDSTDLISVWKEMEELFDAGLAKSIGVSNFTIRQMKKIIANARIQPAALQVELTVYLQQPELARFCEERGIVRTAYAPFGSPGHYTMKDKSSLFEDPVVKLVAHYHSVSPAQVLIRFFIQQGISVIPKSSNPARIKSNGDVWGFNLSEHEMAALRTLDKGEAGRRFDMIFDSKWKHFSEHPEYPF